MPRGMRHDDAMLEVGAPAPASASTRIVPEFVKSSPTETHKRPYRLLVVENEAGEEAPFYSATIGGHAFHRDTQPIRSRKINGETRSYRDHEKGIVEPLSEAELTTVTQAAGKTVVRWVNRASYIAHVVKIENPADFNPETDEPIAPWLRIEPV